MGTKFNFTCAFMKYMFHKMFYNPIYSKNQAYTNTPALIIHRTQSKIDAKYTYTHIYSRCASSDY